MSVPGRVVAAARAGAAAWYRLSVLPATAHLPAPLVYGLARLRGDLRYRRDAIGRARIERNLAAVLGDALTPRQRSAAARTFFREQYCSLMDWLRLRGDGRALTDLVEVRGLEHLRAALAEGRGALVCTGHFGDYQAVFSILGALGIPATAIKREDERTGDDASWEARNDRLLYDALAHHLSRPYLNPIAGQFATAVQAAKVLKQNEVLGVYIDPPALEPDRPRTVPFEFFGREARLLTGSLTVAQKAKSPVFVALLRRAEDGRRQVLEISPAIEVGADPAAAFQRCLAVIEAAVRRWPGQWLYWDRTDDLVDLGLLPDGAAERKPEQAVRTVTDISALVRRRRAAGTAGVARRRARVAVGAGLLAAALAMLLVYAVRQPGRRRGRR